MIQVTIDGQKQSADGRVAKMIRWLLANAPAINAPTKFKLEFDCAGETVRATKQVSEEVKEP